MWPQRQAEIRDRQLQAKERQGWLLPASHQKSARGRKGFPTDFRGNVARSALWSQASSLQNSETIHFCRFKPPSLWCLVTAALGR